MNYSLPSGTASIGRNLGASANAYGMLNQMLALQRIGLHVKAPGNKKDKCFKNLARVPNWNTTPETIDQVYPKVIALLLKEKLKILTKLKNLNFKSRQQLFSLL
ncbi:hypothetical protein AV530_006122 [Patagioenas fasciata monilis]|uniref:Uncharacterized protein n=1 Tax=Patagioenas fasciata monilis TaxID=372326 RepID=A0A1V4J894_PATFA|nr:hypothetical protein AV530_006122 [Patagioenas fasciata monilis]